MSETRSAVYESLLRQASQRMDEQCRNTYVGIDPASEGDWAAETVWRKEDDGRITVVTAARWRPREMLTGTPPAARKPLR